MSDRYYTILRAKEAQSKHLIYVKELLLQGYKVFEVNQNCGDLVPYHTHSHKEIIIVASGKMRMIIEENIIDLSEGEIVTIEPWAIHLSCYPFENGATFYLCFPPFYFYFFSCFPSFYNIICSQSMFPM